jgi:hypothetical protein
LSFLVFFLFVYLSRAREAKRKREKEKQMLLSLVLLSERSTETSLEENTHPAVREKLCLLRESHRRRRYVSVSILLC